jgi:hypothetical protein
MHVKVFMGGKGVMGREQIKVLVQAIDYETRPIHMSWLL